MTLSKRALLSIFPVVLLSNLLISLVVYHAVKTNIIASEESRLRQSVERLQLVFAKEQDFTRNLVFLIRIGDAVKSFIKETNDDFRITAMGVKVQAAIKYFTSGSNRFVAFAILNPDDKPDYYFERSDDPFASMKPEQMQAATNLRKTGGVSSDVYLDDPAAPLLIHSELIDGTTMSAPSPTQKQFALVLQSSLRPSEFLAMKAALEIQYQTAAVVAPSIDAAQFAYVGPLGANLMIGLPLSKAFLTSRLRPIQLAIAASCLIISAAMLALLLSMIRRSITGPIARLEQQLTDVMSGSRETIEPCGSYSEVERLSANIKLLHDETVRSLHSVQQASWTDPLTGLCNRSRFNALGQQLLHRAVAEQSPAYLLFIDLDNFKFVNDTFGHLAGDAVLVQFTKMALANANERDVLKDGLIARLSGDEFAIMLFGAASRQRAAELAQSLVDGFAGGLNVGGTVYPVSASIGIASFPDDSSSSLTHLVSCADRAMYGAKANGRNCFLFYSDELATADRQSAAIERELRKLDPDDEFSLVYMTIEDRNGDVERVEALLRWRSPILGSVSPADFIPLAEARGLISKIDRWVFDRALKDYAALQAALGEDIVLSINISSAELHSSAIALYARARLDRHGIKAEQIEIELTETFAMKASENADKIIQSLRQMGLRIALDDFGAGFTSLKQVLDLELDTIKLDKGIVAKIGTPSGRQMLKAIIELCHSQDRQVVAEGIEDAATRAALELIGCDLFQGYWIGMPMSLADLQAKRRETVAQDLPPSPKEGRTSRSVA